MKQFNIEQAKAGAKVVTRDGKKVTIEDFDRKLPYSWLKGKSLLMGRIEDGSLELWDKEGFINSNHKPDHLDLFLE